MIRYAFIIFTYLFAIYSVAESVDPVHLSPMEGDIVIGDPNSRNVIIEYSSLSCPLCAYFHESVFPQINKKYLQTKKAKLVFRHFAIKASDLKAGAILLCVPDKEHKMFLDVLFKTQRNWSIETSKISETLEHLARLGGIDGKKVQNCLEDKSLEERLVSTREYAQNNMKINAAPTFIINGKKFSGLIDMDVIDKELSS